MILPEELTTIANSKPIFRVTLIRGVVFTAAPIDRP